MGEGDREGVEPVQEWEKFGGGDPKDVSEDRVKGAEETTFNANHNNVDMTG